jgi:hypothetical protein
MTAEFVRVGSLKATRDANLKTGPQQTPQPDSGVIILIRADHPVAKGPHATMITGFSTDFGSDYVDKSATRRDRKPTQRPSGAAHPS